MFMLAESNDPAIHAAFDMTYDWKLFDAFVEIAQGKADARVIDEWLRIRQDGFPKDAYRMLFTSNHDINSWRWSDAELYGDKFRAFAALAATLPGMPLIYGGQESKLDKKIAFFEKDTISWKSYANAAFYKRLLRLKARHPALANGSEGGSLKRIETGDNTVFAFRRVKGRDSVKVAVNLSSIIKKVSGFSKPIAPWDFAIKE
jgi:glycosidase